MKYREKKKTIFIIVLFCMVIIIGQFFSDINNKFVYAGTTESQQDLLIKHARKHIGQKRVKFSDRGKTIILWVVHGAHGLLNIVVLRWVYQKLFLQKAMKLLQIWPLIL